MKVPKKYKERVFEICVEDDGYTRQYELVLADGWSDGGQHVFICDTQREVLDIIMGAAPEMQT